MRKLIEFKIEVGDANYVKPGELFAELSADGKTITAIKKREDDLSLTTVVETPVTLPVLEENKTATYSIAALEAGSVEIKPSSGKDAMKKVTITFTE